MKRNVFLVEIVIFVYYFRVMFISLSRNFYELPNSWSSDGQLMLLRCPTHLSQVADNCLLTILVD